MQVHYSKSFSISYDVSFQKAAVVDIKKELVLCGHVQDALEPGYHRYVRVMKLMRRFLEALPLVEKLNNEAAREELNAT